MKIHRVVQMLGATTSTGKLADDMYDLGHKDYYSEAQGTYLPISHMDFQHMVRAFVKLTEQEEVLDRSKHMGRVKDQAKFYDDIVENNDKIYKKNLAELQDKYDELRKTYAVLLEDYNTDTGRGIWKEKYEEEVKNAEYWKNTYYNSQPKGCGYVFSEIPNDTDGQEFVDKMKKFFNKKTYKMRVRGQHIKPELKGTGATYWGQSLDESTHMRIYIETKRGD